MEVRVRAGITASDHAFCREAAVGGVAIASLPSMLVEADLAARKLVRVLEPYVLGEGCVHFVYLGSRLLQPKIRAFRDFLVERSVSAGRAQTRRGVEQLRIK